VRLFPRPDLVVLLEISPQEAMRRKDDIPSADYLESRQAIYRSIAAGVDAASVDAARPVEEVQRAITEIVKGALK
jgi:thymidylate kinase